MSQLRMSRSETSKADAEHGREVEALHGAGTQVHTLSVVLTEVKTERAAFRHHGVRVFVAAEEQLLVGSHFKEHTRI